MKKPYFTLIPAWIALLLLEFYILWSSAMSYTQDKSIAYNAVHFLWLSSPVLLVFFVFRLVRIRPMLAFCLTSCLWISLDLINQKKTLLTAIPLSFKDVISGYNLVVAFRYMPTISYFIIPIIGAWLFFLYQAEKKRLGKEPFRFSNLIMVALIAPFCFYLYIQDYWLKGTTYYPKIDELTRYFEISNKTINGVDNDFLRGLPMYLIKTSKVPSLPIYSKEQQQKFLAYNAIKTLSPDAPKTVIYILCESCWYDQQHLRQLYQPLINLGFAESRATSPVYGGGTANSEFEMLTGLPSVTPHLTGIIYEEYTNKLREKVDTLPSHLNNNGYITYAGHNDIPEFYHRNIVYPKFGFQEYQSINDMGTLPEVFAKQRKAWQWQADDYLVFNAAIKRLKAAKGSRIFMHLLTMTTHGPYHQKDELDDGSEAYSFQVQQSMSRIAQFTTQVEAIDPNALIVIYGDHKPALNNYFTRNHIMTEEDFFNGPSSYGDVPVLIKTPAKAKLQQLIQQSNHKPFYCLTNAIDNIFIGTRPFAFKSMQEKGCLKPGPYNYSALSESAPGWLFAVSLF